MKPYYERDGITIYHGDALEIVCELPDRSVDAILTDPPYCAGSVSEASRSAAKGQGLRSENIQRFGWFVGDNMGTAGLVFLLRSIAFEAARVLKESGSLLTFCDWRMVASLEPAIKSAGLRFQNIVVWDRGRMGLGAGFRPQHEMALHFTNGSPNYCDRGVGNVIRSTRVSASEREHQTQKPVDLLSRMLGVVCPPEGIVLDPFCGSGSTLLAASTLGMRAIGVEREERYCDIAAKRLAQGVLAFDAPEREA